MAIAEATRRVVRLRANERCEYCHADERWQFVRFTLDHIQPRSHGGTDESSNLVPACRNCNERRGNRCEATDSETKSVVALFNPRSQNWSEHFAWSADKTRIVGTSPTGRAAVQLLDMNDDRHDGNIVRVRLRDLEDGFHPPADDPVSSKQV